MTSLKKQKVILDETFDDLENIEISSEIANQTIIYRKNKTKKIKLPDALILASAKVAGADLITDNYGDFQNIDSSINVVNLDNFRV